MRQSPLLAALLISLSVAVSACGGVDKNAYVESVTKVQQQTQKDTSALSGQISSAKTPAQIADKLDQLGRAIETNADSLGEIKPPDDVAKEHAQYVSLYRNFGKSLESLAAKVKKATPATATKLMADASKVTSELATGESKLVGQINSKLKG